MVLSASRRGMASSGAICDCSAAATALWTSTCTRPYQGDCAPVGSSRWGEDKPRVRKDDPVKDAIEMHARNAADHVRHDVERAEDLAEQVRAGTFPAEEGGFGAVGWLSYVARQGLLKDAYLQNLGHEWLSAQPADVQGELAQAAARLRELLRWSLQQGAVELPPDQALLSGFWQG